MTLLLFPLSSVFLPVNPHPSLPSIPNQDIGPPTTFLFMKKVYNWVAVNTGQEAGLDYSYDLAPELKSSSDQGKVTDMESMKYIMRYNSM